MAERGRGGWLSLSRRDMILVALVVLFSLEYVCEAGKDFYAILGVPKTADQKQISKAYRELSRKFHPDKNPGNKEAETKFVEISSAYDVLSDPDKRRTYDMYGEEGLSQQGGGGRGGFDPFESFFNFGGHSHSHQQQMNKKPDIVLPLEVTLEELYSGATHRIEYRKQGLCTHCRGTGTKNPNDLETCSDCKGKGIKITQQQLGPGFIQQIQTVCNKCGGKGRIAKSKCLHCKGSKVELVEDVLTLEIEKGMADGQRIVFNGEGDQSPDTQPGDVVLEIVTAPHPRFVRKGNDLYTKVDITLLEALVGFKKTLKHIDGHKVELERNEITVPGHVDTIYEEGMPHHNFASSTGNLLVEYHVEFPKHLTQVQKEEIKRIFANL